MDERKPNSMEAPTDEQLDAIAGGFTVDPDERKDRPYIELPEVKLGKYVSHHGMNPFVDDCRESEEGGILKKK